MTALWDALSTAAGLFWRAAWALALGCAISAAIQVFVSRRQPARHLGSGTPRQLAVAMVLGFASSSCSFAALSATRSLFHGLWQGTVQDPERDLSRFGGQVFRLEGCRGRRGAVGAGGGRFGSAT